jgi:hypothetical protein
VNRLALLQRKRNRGAPATVMLQAKNVVSRIHPDLDHISISDRANLPAINPDLVL